MNLNVKYTREIRIVITIIIVVGLGWTSQEVFWNDLGLGATRILLTQAKGGGQLSSAGLTKLVDRPREVPVQISKVIYTRSIRLYRRAVTKITKDQTRVIK